MQRSAMPNSSGPAFPNAIPKRDSQTRFSNAIPKRDSQARFSNDSQTRPVCRCINWLTCVLDFDRPVYPSSVCIHTYH